MALKYWKCRGDCLEVVATDFDVTAEDKCAICGGTFAFMGIVQDDKLYNIQQRCACNHSCTHAHGPRCDCGCHGANHGTDMVVQKVIVSGIPTIPAHDAEKAMARMKEWRPLRRKIDHRIAVIREITAYSPRSLATAGYSIRYTAWGFIPLYRKLSSLKTHFHRMKNGKQLIKKMDLFIDSLVDKYGHVIPLEFLEGIKSKYYFAQQAKGEQS